MSLIYVTGIEAAGKTTTCNELKRLGYEAYDIDQDIAHFYSIITGEEAKPTNSDTKRTESWYNQHLYMMDRAKVEEYKKQATDKTIFLCGTTRNDWRVIDLFDQVIYLYLDENTLNNRLLARKPFEFGNAPHERKMILNWRQPTEDDYREYGAIMVDATRPTEEVVDAILANVHHGASDTIHRTFSAGGIILNAHKEVLLVNEGDGFWGFPKGRIEKGETAFDTALREIKEETDLTDMVKIKELGTYQRHPVINGKEDKTELKSITLFLFRTNQELPNENSESNQCAWFALTQAASKLSHAKDKEFFEQVSLLLADTTPKFPK